MARRLITTSSPFETAYGYSRAVVDGGIVYVSGTTGYDYEKMAMPHDVGEQTRSIFRTVEQVLKDAGSSMKNILRCQYFVIDHTYCEPVLKVCGEVLGDIRPAAGIYVVTALLKPEMKVEIEVTARVG
jgi:enamine deaminase RidA (YjgF/YER057c/UK114 family)